MDERPPCVVCHGSKRVGFDKNGSGIPSDLVWETCIVCEGTGLSKALGTGGVAIYVVTKDGQLLQGDDVRCVSVPVAKAAAFESAVHVHGIKALTMFGFDLPTAVEHAHSVARTSAL